MKLRDCIAKEEVFENGTILLDLRSNAIEDRKKTFNTLCALGFNPNINFVRITKEVTPYIVTLIDDKFQCQHFYINSHILEEDAIKANAGLLEKGFYTKGVHPKDYLNAITSRAILEYLNEK